MYHFGAFTLIMYHSGALTQKQGAGKTCLFVFGKAEQSVGALLLQFAGKSRILARRRLRFTTPIQNDIIEIPNTPIRKMTWKADHG